MATPRSTLTHLAQQAAVQIGFTVRRVGARIFADLLPQTTRDPAPVPAAPPLGIRTKEM